MSNYGNMNVFGPFIPKDKPPEMIEVIPGEYKRFKFTSPWIPDDNNTYYPMSGLGYAPLINGERAFRALANAIRNASESIEIISWGFQPSMYLERSPDNKTCLGELLEEKARQGVQVRILIWFAITGQLDPNFPGWGAQEKGSSYGKGGVINPSELVDNGVKLACETDGQYNYDKLWHYKVRKGQIPNIYIRSRDMPVIWSSRENLLSHPPFTTYNIKRDEGFLRAFFLKKYATHHQKMALIDYEYPQKALGFMMGHNLLSNYWDNDQHSSSLASYNTGRDGPVGWQDISGAVCGEILHDMNDNFAKAWTKHGEQGNDFELRRLVKNNREDYSLENTELLPWLNKFYGLSMRPALGKVCLTQPEYNQFDILKAYMEGIIQARKYIYIENQYFRMIDIANQIKQVAAQRHALITELGGDTIKPIYLFVVTNSTDDIEGPSNRAGSFQTFRMLEVLGRADLMPVYTAKQRGVPEDEIEEEKVPGLETVICTLVSLDSHEKKWSPVYVHSKLMMIDDQLMIQGSANINLRSMAFDSETAVVLQDTDVTQIIPPMRRHLWGLHAQIKEMDKKSQPSQEQKEEEESQDEIEREFDRWKKIITTNKNRKKNTNSPLSPLIEFIDRSDDVKNMD
ncbi:phosphatidylserine/phosphatidylglycerophosphate/cardiolipin synthase family protein [Xenorhabdus sp. M]|uniref:Phosphatidylserine/phosphatidylglycerophosphate/ cardiolipin synthase family protein n=2 Tax=Xenorhabdus szentirmaii TaxID=290112 RepID=A0AAW3YXM9_9GAMM|nr:phospholipase D-like domain-containing protein [Xenorhabdus sp. M]MBD2801078.1 phosphatidylserine/phosphatidylglycerophosphate/cardiolipin synthase family protein [Xenorhabdus sp. M]